MELIDVNQIWNGSLNQSSKMLEEPIRFFIGFLD